jgi:hypothetical protein
LDSTPTRAFTVPFSMFLVLFLPYFAHVPFFIFHVL